MPESSTSGSKVAPQGRKRAASKAIEKRPAKRRKAGMLETVVTELPMDIVLHIFNFVDPQCLINLSRSNQLFRKTLLSSDLFWKMARLGAGMPDLEAQDITERQYILLVFDKNCHSCSQRNVQEINFVNCARLCSSCRQNTRVTEARRRRLLKSLHPMAEECAKYTDDSGYRIPRGIEKLSRKLHKLQGTKLDEFVAERKLLKEQIERDAKKIEGWITQQYKNKYDEESANHRSREESIKKNLMALGWKVLPTTWTSKREVNQPRKLTPRIWKKIEGPLVKSLRVDLINSYNQTRRRALFTEYDKLMQQDSQPDLFPSRSTFFELPSVKPLWEKDYGPDPPAVELEEFSAFVEAEWLTALADIHADIAGYQQSMRDLASQRLTNAYVEKGLPVPDSPIDDPRSYFRYRERDRGWDYPEPEVVILKFPAIHRVMRDRHSAAEFKSVPPGRWDGMDETLNVVLKDP